MKTLRALTLEEFSRVEARLRNPAPGSTAEQAKNFGIDLTLLIEQLRLSPAERVKRMIEVTRTVERVRGAALRRPA